MTNTDLLLTFYGDDFTGSTDALEGLADNGVRALLFMEPPTPEELERFDDLDAVGVAGVSRTMTPDEMKSELPAVFDRFADLHAPIVHYKVCSTFDSSPDVGSIGTAIDIAQEVFDSPFVPVSQGTEVPHGRYVTFSNLFAEHGGEMYRIDRHPTMRDHPVTPMRESDLRRHLSEQTDRPIGGVDRRFIEEYNNLDTALDETAADNEIIVLDALHSDHLSTIGHLLWDRATDTPGQLFAVGSSGLEHHALVSHWDKIGLIDRQRSFFEKREPVDQIAVMSGSASSETAAQIDWASDHGFHLISIDTERLVDPDQADDARSAAVDSALNALEAGESVVLFSARGPDDPAIDATRKRFEAADTDESLESYLGRQQGIMFRDILRRADLTRASVAGGDTSSHVISQLDLKALEAVAPVAPGAPLCRVHSENEDFDGLELTLKGGQVHTENDEFDYFGAVRRGGVKRTD